MIKLTLLYGHPTDPAEFENYYTNTHMPIALTMKGQMRTEISRCLRTADGKLPAFYRMAEFWFESPEALQATLNSPEGKATGADLANFATGGVTFLTAVVER